MRCAHYTESVADTSARVVKYRTKHTFAFKLFDRYLIITWVWA